MILNLLLQEPESDRIFTWKLPFYGRVLKSISWLVFVILRKAADKMRIAILQNKDSKDSLLVTSNKLTSIFAGLGTSGLEPDVARGPPVGLRRHYSYLMYSYVPKWCILLVSSTILLGESLLSPMHATCTSHSILFHKLDKCPKNVSQKSNLS
jgi:hypothetical protein